MAELTYSVKEAAEALGVSQSVVYNLIHQTGFPSLMVGGRRLISRELLAAWVRKEASKGNATSENDCNPMYKETRSQF